VITRIDTTGRFAQAVRAGELVFLAGQVADDWQADFPTQCRQVMARIDRLLAEASASKSTLLQMQVWLKSLDDYQAFNALYDGWIDPAAKPARATVKADLIAPSLLVEIMVVARAGGGDGR
jgi:enamine deaminase RidA (YjgF/YER057c/UK114 family)